MYNSPECSCDILILHSDLQSNDSFGIFSPYAFINNGLLLTGWYLRDVFELQLCSVLELIDELGSLFNGWYWKVSNEDE